MKNEILDFLQLLRQQKEKRKGYFKWK